MATFRVGQRVRIVADCNRYGMEAIIKSDIALCDFVELGYQALAYDVTVIGHPDDDFAYEPHELEPIVDQGRQVISWAECLWQPTKEFV